MNTTFPTEDTRWQAVVNRDRGADGHFWLGVMTTGVFCRPGCPARTPLRKNVVFFDSLADALRSGLRPCKRCRPLGTSIDANRIAIVVESCRMMMDADAPLTLDELAARHHMSPSHFQKMFSETVGISPAQFARGLRAERIQTALPLADSVIRAAGDAGYTSSAQLYADAPDVLGMSPGAFRNKGKGETIRFAIVDSFLGKTLIAATERGICRLQFGDDESTLLESLETDFANATMASADEEFHNLVERTMQALGTPHAVHLPLDVRGTAFQVRVWNALRHIPFGETVSYGELAKSIGQPTASRAVASACGRNDVAVLIPCHRVVGKDGSLTGYRWGTERKQFLLAKERSAS